MGFWETIKRDLQKGLAEGMTAVREGANLVQKKAGELTDEGRRKYQLHELRAKVRTEMAELGGRVHAASKKAGNPLLDPKVKTVLARIDRLEKRIAEAAGKAAPKRAPKAAAGRTRPAAARRGKPRAKKAAARKVAARR